MLFPEGKELKSVREQLDKTMKAVEGLSESTSNQRQARLFHDKHAMSFVAKGRQTRGFHLCVRRSEATRRKDGRGIYPATLFFLAADGLIEVQTEASFT